MLTAVGFLLGSAREDRILGLELFCFVLILFAVWLIVQAVRTRIDQRRNRDRYAMSMLANEYADALVAGRPVGVESLIERCPEAERENLRRVCRVVDAIQNDRIDRSMVQFGREVQKASPSLVRQIDQIGRSKGLS